MQSCRVCGLTVALLLLLLLLLAVVFIQQTQTGI
jgi:hypothetical protein